MADYQRSPSVQRTPSVQPGRKTDDKKPGPRAIVRRPGYSTVGRPLKVLTNHLALIDQGLFDKTVHHYDVIIAPLGRQTKDGETLPPPTNRKVWTALEHAQPDFGQAWPVYDGQKNAFSTVRWDFPAQEDSEGKSRETGEFHVSLTTAGQQSEDFSVILRRVTSIDMSVLRRFVDSGETNQEFSLGELNHILTAITVLNICIRHEPTFQFPSNLNAFYTDQSHVVVSGGIEIWRGYFQSVRCTPGRLLVNTDISAGAFIMRGDLIKVCLAYLHRNNPQDIEANRMSDRERISLDRFVRGMLIFTTHNQVNGQTPKSRKIKSVKNVDANSGTFTPFGGGPLTTVGQHFAQLLGQPLRYPRLPLVEVGPIMLPMELCQVVPGQKFAKKLNPEQTAQCLKFTTMKPDQRVSAIKAAVMNLKYANNPRMRQFGFGIDSKLVEIEARQLDPPKLLFNGDEQSVRDGQWSMNRMRFWRAEKIRAWGILIIPGGRFPLPQQAIDKFYRDFVTAAQDLGMQGFGQFLEQRPAIHYGNPQDIGNSIRDAGHAVKDATGHFPDILFVVLPDKTEATYAAVKSECETKIGVLSQCVQADKVRRNNRSYFINVALKVNTKLGGINFTLPIKELQFVAETPTMVFGLDVSHPSPGPGASGRPSISAVVASMDRYASNYQATMRLQQGRTEMIDGLADMVVDLLERFKKLWKRLPERILIFRDGASEGQFKEILDTEVPAFRLALEAVGGDHKPPISYIVAAKRHRMRIMPAPGSRTDRSGNCPAGLVVDREVGHPREFDFFLLSHSGLLGTSRPTHYSVILDENDLGANRLQALTYALTHSFTRSTRAISTNPATAYASLVCSRARLYFGHNEGWSDDSATETSRGSKDPETKRRVEAAQKDKLDKYRAAFTPVAHAIESTMYFC